MAVVHQVCGQGHRGQAYVPGLCCSSWTAPDACKALSPAAADVWIHPSKAFVLEVKGAEIIDSGALPPSGTRSLRELPPTLTPSSLPQTTLPSARRCGLMR